MPLSEHEQRLLDQIERALYAEDPKFASAVRSTDPRVHARRRLSAALALVVVGVGLLIAGSIRSDIVVADLPILLICGAVASAAGVVLLALSYRRASRRRPLRVVGGGSVTPTRKRSSVTTRMEDRWRRRDDQRGL